MSERATATSALTYAVAGRARPGETESGDGYVVVPCVNGTLAAVIDGLGHGPMAAAATKDAQAVLESQSARNGHDLPELVRRCQRQLIGTRGAVMTLAFFSAASPTMVWIGVGNVEGVLLRAAPRLDSTRVVLRGGVVGGTVPSLHCSTVTLTDGDVLVLATDGITSRFSANVDRASEPAQIADDILGNFAKESDDALVLVARWNASP